MELGKDLLFLYLFLLLLKTIMIFLLLVRKSQQDKTQKSKTHTHDMEEVAHRLIDTAQEIKKCDLKKITFCFYEISLIK